MTGQNPRFQSFPEQKKEPTGVVETAKQAASSVAEGAEHAWDKTCEQARDLASNVADQAEDAMQEINSFIRRYPLAVLAGGFVLGFLACAAFRSYEPDMTRRMSNYSA